MKMVNAVLSSRGPAPHPSRQSRLGPPLIDAVKRRDAAQGDVAYWVTGAPAYTASGLREKRADARERTRLRSAKALDDVYRFLCECRICDRSLNGLQIRLVRNVCVPRLFAVHIDETGEVRRARVMWRKGLMLGVRLYDLAPPGALKPSDRLALSERYYAIPN